MPCGGDNVPEAESGPVAAAVTPSRAREMSAEPRVEGSKRVGKAGVDIVAALLKDPMPPPPCDDCIWRDVNRGDCATRFSCEAEARWAWNSSTR